MPSVRTIMFAGHAYKWRVYHRHVPGGVGCSEVFFACREGFRRSGFRLVFPETAEHGCGYPGMSGEVVDHRAPGWVLQLHLPRVAASLIGLGLSIGWRPEASRSEHVVGNAYDLVRMHRDLLADVMAP